MFYITDKHCENVNVSSFRRRNKHIFQSSAAQSKTKYAVRFVSQVKGESCLLPGFVLLLLRHQWNAWFSNMFIIHQTHTHTHTPLFITDLKILPWPKRVNKHPCSYVKFEADDIEQQSADAFVWTVRVVLTFHNARLSCAITPSLYFTSRVIWNIIFLSWSLQTCFK